MSLRVFWASWAEPPRRGSCWEEALHDARHKGYFPAYRTII